MLKWRLVASVLLLIGSNTFMTFAWYYHVKKQAWPLLVAIGISWLIALPEYCLQVPANRIGHVDYGGPLTLPQLKVIQEAITLGVFVLFTIWVAGEKPRANEMAAFGLIFAAVALACGGEAPGVDGCHAPSARNAGTTWPAWVTASCSLAPSAGPLRPVRQLPH
jgi:uncharacterized protein (DUF486 family)